MKRHPRSRMLETVKTFTALSEEFVEVHLRHDPVEATRLGLHDYDAKLPTHTPDSFKAHAAWLRDLEQRLVASVPWDELPLDCLAGAFEKPDVVPAKDFGKVLDICAGGAGKDKTAKMDERLKQAMADLGKEARGAAASGAPAASAVRAIVRDLAEGERVLDPETSRYLCRVLRLTKGASFVAFDPARQLEANAIKKLRGLMVGA